MPCLHWQQNTVCLQLVCVCGCSSSVSLWITFRHLNKVSGQIHLFPHFVLGWYCFCDPVLSILPPPPSPSLSPLLNSGSFNSHSTWRTLAFWTQHQYHSHCICYHYVLVHSTCVSLNLTSPHILSPLNCIMLHCTHGWPQSSDILLHNILANLKNLRVYNINII